MIETGRDIGDGLRNGIYGVEIGIDQRIVAGLWNGVAADNVLASHRAPRLVSGTPPGSKVWRRRLKLIAKITYQNKGARAASV